MLKLLNRFAWVIALSFGFIITFIFIGLNTYRFNSDVIFFSGIIGIIVGIIIKKLFLSKNFIQDRLEFFAESIKHNYIGEKEEQNIIHHPLEASFNTKGNIEKVVDLEKIEEIKVEEKIINNEIKTEEKLYIQPENKEPSAFDLFFEKIGNYIKDFFSTNLLAKLGAILVFLAVIYFLKGFVGELWEIIGPVGRIIVGILIGFATYLFGIKIHGKYENEGIILMGTGILINFAVILAGRYLVGDGGYLSEGSTFLFLILNTIFAVLTSLIYKSKTLLIFSFIFAYLNPFIIGAESNGTPYTLIGYSLIVSLGALFLANKDKSILLFAISFIAGNFLFLVAPFIDGTGALAKLIVLNIFNIAAIYSILNFDKKYNFIIEYLFGAVFLVIGMFYFSLQNFVNIDFTLYLISIISALLFLFISYFLSNKKALLYSIGTLGTVGTLGLLINTNSDFIGFKIGILALIIFGISNLLFPFINDKLLKKKNFNSLVIGSILGVGFIAFQIYNFGEEYFKGMTQGLVFLTLAIVYFLQSYFIIQKVGIENMKKDEDLKNIFYAFAGISISLFSIAIAFIFSDYPEIISAVWLFEATILYYFYSKNNSLKVFIAATVLFFIGLSKFGILLNYVESEDYKFLISFVIILASFILNLFFINKGKEEIIHHPSGASFNTKGSIGENIHSIGHIIGMGIMGGLLLQIIPSTGHGWSLFGISIFITILGYFYAKFNLIFLKIVFVILIGLFGLLHIGELNSVFYKLQRDELEYLKILQYIVSAIIISNLFIWKPHLTSPKRRVIGKILLTIISLYSFIISNLFILDLFGNIFGDFTLTIYWGLIASALLIYGIQKDIIKYRTIGLYFLLLTSAKIFLYDVWQIGDTNSRVAVFAILGVIFIIISTLYSKRFGNNMKGEFSFDNLKSTLINKDENIEIKSKNNINKKVEENIEKNIEEENIFMKKLKKIDIEDIKVVRFFPNKSEKFTIRAKNLIRVVKLITDKTKKTSFKSKELINMYDFIIKNYKTDLSRREYDKIRTLVKDFIDEGGEIEIVIK